MKETKNQHQEMMSLLSSLTSRPSLLLHACCGPCLAYPLTLFDQYFDIQVAFINHNISPFSEWVKRRDEAKRLIDNYNKDYQRSVQFVAPPYDHESFSSAVKGLENCPENGDRCLLCHQLRLEKAYAFADGRFDYFTSVMTVSSHKPSALLNSIGTALNVKYPKTIFIPTDLKKENGQQIGNKIAKKYDIYRQDYCGCEFSYRKNG